MLTRTPSSIPNSNLIPSDISPPPSTLHQPSLHTANTTNLQPTPIEPQPTPSAFQPTHIDPLPTHTNPLPTRTNPHLQPTNPQPIHPMITRSKNSITKPKTFTNGTVRYPVPSALLADGNPSIVEPICFANAMKDSNWCAAMNVEFDALLKNQTWLLVPSHTATLMPCYQSSKTPSFRGSRTPSVRSRRPIPTWMFQISKWSTKLRSPPCLLLQITQTTSLLKLTVKAKGNQPQLNPSLTRPISPSLRLLLRLLSRQPSNPSQSSKRVLQPKHSYFHVFIYFCYAFFIFGEQFLSVMVNV